jgi:hypothetical protein
MALEAFVFPSLSPIWKIENKGSVYYQIYLTKDHLPTGK